MDLRVGVEVQKLPEHELRMEMARAEASYELGDASWADHIVDVYLGAQDPSLEAIEAWED